MNGRQNNNKNNQQNVILTQDQVKNLSQSMIKAAEHLNATLNPNQFVNQPTRRGRPKKQQTNNNNNVGMPPNNNLNHQQTTTNKKLYADAAKNVPNSELHKIILELQAKVEQLQARVSQLEQKNTQKSDQTNHTIPPKVSLSAINNAANDSLERERRSKNVIIRGLEYTGNENENTSEKVEEFLSAVCHKGMKVKKAQRLHSRSLNIVENIPSKVPSILVVLNDADEAKEGLKNARHHTDDQFKGVFAHDDRTKAQQYEYSEIAKLTKKKNEQLKSVNLLDQPFRYVVRSDRVRCIDVQQSKDQKKSIYIDDKDVKQKIEEHLNCTRLNNGIENGAINPHRGSTIPSSKGNNQPPDESMQH